MESLQAKWFPIELIYQLEEPTSTSPDQINMRLRAPIAYLIREAVLFSSHLPAPPTYPTDSIQPFISNSFQTDCSSAPQASYWPTFLPESNRGFNRVVLRLAVLAGTNASVDLAPATSSHLLTYGLTREDAFIVAR
ncbi:unnamed protein product, partial [Protopolystoma xenopodis]